MLWPDKPRWAPDGRTLYFISRRPTWSFNLWAVRFDPERGTPVDEPFALTQFDSPSLVISPDMARSEMDVSSRHAVLTMKTVTRQHLDARQRGPVTARRGQEARNFLVVWMFGPSWGNLRRLIMPLDELMAVGFHDDGRKGPTKASEYGVGVDTSTRRPSPAPRRGRDCEVRAGGARSGVRLGVGRRPARESHVLVGPGHKMTDRRATCS